MTTQIMILGSYHMDNPGRDVIKLNIPDVCTPEKQAQIREVTDLLAEFKPNKIALEVVADHDNLISSIFEGFTPERLLQSRNERDQIGLRLAHQLGHDRVYGIDEQSQTIDYFPFGHLQEFAQNNDQNPILERLFANAEQSKLEVQKRHQTASVRELLLECNDPNYGVAEMKSFYLPVFEIGNLETHPGADLNAMWYLRNAKIFSKLRKISAPGDKILVLFGAGHNFWLRHFVQLTPEFELIEANDFLKA
jgi:hypothetical protein